ncbi:hypothetical protein Ddep01_01873 [Deinococcus depolymerans]|uniref:TolC family protein n=1 Tax=Deinococcus depolymerans TaxID=392408 RepID=UPI0030A46C94
MPQSKLPPPERTVRLRRRALLLGLSALLASAQAQQMPVTSPAPAPLSAPVTPAASPLPTVTVSPEFAALLELLRRSPDWRAADLRYRAAQLTLDSARARAGLSLIAGADGSLTRLPWDSGDWSGRAALTVSAGLSVLPWSAALEGVRSAGRALDSAALELRGTRAGLTVGVAQAYEAARAAAAGLALADAQLALATRQAQVTQAQRAQGLLSAEAALGQQAALDGAQAAQARAGRALAQAGRTLNRLLGQPVALPAQAASFAAPPQVTVPGDLDALIARAQQRRPEVARARAALADAQAALGAAQLDARLPDLNASVRAGQLSDAQGNPGRTVSGTLNLRAGTVGAQLSVPLRDTAGVPNGVALSLSASVPLLGSGRSAALTQAQLGETQARLALDSALQSVELDVRSRFDSWNDEQAAVNAARSSAEQARTALNSARARLEAGLITPLDLQQAELTAQQAALNLTAQQNAAALAALDLAQATTDLDPLLATGGPR